ncbi:MAG: malto-oligosyltrehalose synthase [Dehalococcoidia bacterium]
MVRLRVPIATYRLQFNGGFRFEDARSIVPYLSRLGISDLYASPIFKARQGSSHGYDITDPSSLNPELGTRQDFESLVRELKAQGMGLLLDIVPNHLAATQDNPWWMDLLENGRASPYAAFFDIDWRPARNAPGNRLLLPVLSSTYHQALENGEILLTMVDAGLFVHYHSVRLPLDIKSYSLVISHHLSALEENLGADHPTFQQLKQLLDAMERLPAHTNHSLRKISETYRERQLVKERFRQLVSSSPEAGAFIRENVAWLNGKMDDPQSFDQLDRLLAQQAYQLAFWKTALTDINYRRFFDISDLIAMRVENPGVFEATHALIQQLVQQGKVTGLRVDHIDGLYDPFEYLCRLQHHISPQAGITSPSEKFYVIVEKILTGDETLPEEWPVFGTTGYDSLNAFNAVFVDDRRAQDLDDVYIRTTGGRAAFADVVYQKKGHVIDQLFAGELRALADQLARLAQLDQDVSEVSRGELTKAIAGVTASLATYRTYTRNLEISPQDRRHLECAIHEVRQREPDLDTRALAFLERVLLLDFPGLLAPEQKDAWLHFVMRWQQFTGPVMAKGFEDTALYVHNRLVSLNEVGGNPGARGISVEAFHHHNLTRQARWPLAMNATSTHDTKRSEDVRARINVISEDPHSWERHLSRWIQWNEPKKQKVAGEPVPEPELEVLIYQTLIGSWPLSTKEMPKFRDRFKAYIIKAAREAKSYTNWLSPNPEYESALLAFVESILDSTEQSKFLQDFSRYQEKTAYCGALNSLSQVLLKVTSPGVPDFYQGTELWDFSLVDPDNRRPVDYEQPNRYLDSLVRREAPGQSSLIQELLTSWKDGRIKLYVTYKSLALRKAYRDLFVEGDYIPLKARGQRHEHVCAFARRQGMTWALVVAPRFLSRLIHVDTLPLGHLVWGEDTLPLPEGAPRRWIHAFTGESTEVLPKTREMHLSDIFLKFPVALLVSAPEGAVALAKE